MYIFLSFEKCFHLRNYCPTKEIEHFYHVRNLLCVPCWTILLPPIHGPRKIPIGFWSIYTLVVFSRVLYKQNHNVWILYAWLPSLMICFWETSMLLHAFFFLLATIPFSVKMILYPSSVDGHLCQMICVDKGFRLSWVNT